jgi:hypothetical protein
MCGTGPLAIDHFVKVVWRRDVGWFHSYLCPRRLGSLSDLILTSVR